MQQSVSADQSERSGNTVAVLISILESGSLAVTRVSFEVRVCCRFSQTLDLKQQNRIKLDTDTSNVQDRIEIEERLQCVLRVSIVLQTGSCGNVSTLR